MAGERGPGPLSVLLGTGQELRASFEIDTESKCGDYMNANVFV